MFDHLTGLGVKPNAMSYSLLVDAHLINRDQKAALSVIEDMVKKKKKNIVPGLISSLSLLNVGCHFFL